MRDKDAVNACLMICGMTAYYKKKGRGLLEVPEELKYEYGAYDEKLLIYSIEGSDGLIRMREVMARLRGNQPEMLAGKSTVETIDYLDSEKTGLPSSDVLEFRLENGGRVTVRPSGMAI